MLLHVPEVLLSCCCDPTSAICASRHSRGDAEVSAAGVWLHPAACAAYDGAQVKGGAVGQSEQVCKLLHLLCCCCWSAVRQELLDGEEDGVFGADLCPGV